MSQGVRGSVGADAMDAIGVRSDWGVHPMTHAAVMWCMMHHGPMRVRVCCLVTK